MSRVVNYFYYFFHSYCTWQVTPDFDWTNRIFRRKYFERRISQHFCGLGLFVNCLPKWTAKYPGLLSCFISWWKLGGHGRDGDGPGGFPPQDCKRYCGDDGVEGKRQGMGAGISGSRAGSDRALANEGLYANVAGKHCGVHIREAYLRAVYRGGEYGGI